MKALKLQFSSVSTEALGFKSMFSIPSSTINLLKVGSSRGLHSQSLSILLRQDLNILDTEDQDWEYHLDVEGKDIAGLEGLDLEKDSP
ncbi:hypothetical protein Tco_1284501 [Tanacetum coccineum]